MQRLNHQAILNKETKEQTIIPNGKKIRTLHGVAPKEGAKFDLILKDCAGRERHRERIETGHERFGVGVDLDVDSEMIIAIDNIESTGDINIFAD